MTDAEHWNALYETATDSKHIWTPAPDRSPQWADGVRASLLQIVPHITGGLYRGGTVLDLGCGIGRITNALAAYCPHAEIVGVDVSALAIQTACSMRDEQGRSNATYLLGDGTVIPDLGRRTLDAAYSMLLFQHVSLTTIRGYLSSLAAWMRNLAVLRVQWTWEPDQSYGKRGDYAWNHRDDQIVACALDAGFHSMTVEPHHDPDYPTWAWRSFRYDV